MNKYFISFGVPNRNLGCVVIEAPTPAIALVRASDMGLNPGGQAAIWEISNEEAKDLGLDMLITPDQLDAKGYTRRSKATPIERKKFMDRALIVCANCNR